ncbi:hypothetical protein [Paenibacillus sp.]|uniref:hypothetical protein n=1 Tax=Paenibacillus sp. TaxID=58172 RepID=UPI002D32B2F4|nr:hypothetical protein [Paenibacillus sp.]HZG58117.1 hypothetical protein [Paenibacillus sp.]
MLRDVLTEAELQALLGPSDEGSARADGVAPAEWDGDDRKLLHALVRNQLRLLHMIEEMQSELRMLKAVSTTGPSARQTTAGLEPLPLPFMKQSGGAPAGEDERQAAPAAEASRKERHKRKSLW